MIAQYLHTLLSRGERQADGPWPCLPGCKTHHGGTTGDDPTECFASERVGIIRLSGHPRGLELEVVVDQFAERGVSESATVAIVVQPQGACDDGLFVMTLDEARQHIAHMQAAVTAAARASYPREALRATAGGDV